MTEKPNKPFIARLREAYDKAPKPPWERNAADREKLVMVRNLTEDYLRIIDKYMTDPEQIFNEKEYNNMHAQLEVCEDIMSILTGSQTYDACTSREEFIYKKEVKNESK